VTTQVYVMVPRALAARAPHVDVVAAMDERPRSRAVSLKVIVDGAADTTPLDSDPFADVEV
jgi:hypothetical protein